MRRAFFSLLLAVACFALAESADQRYANGYRAICERYAALARQFSREDVFLPKGATRRGKLMILAAREESDASRMRVVAEELRSLVPTQRFKPLHAKTLRFLDLNSSQPIERAQQIRKAAATHRQVDMDAMEAHHEQVLLATAAAVETEAAKLRIYVKLR